MSAVLDALVGHPQSLPPLAGALAQVALALYLVVKTGERGVRSWFALIAFSSAIWSMGSALSLAAGPLDEALARSCAQASFAAIAIIGPSALEFAAALARRRTRAGWPALVLGIAVAATVLFVPSLTRVSPRISSGWWPSPCPGVFLAALSSIPAMLAGTAVIARVWLGLLPSRRRRQLGWAMAALLMGACGSVDLYTLFASDAYPIGWATGTLSSLILFYAIAQHRLMAIRTFLQQTAVAFVSVLASAAVGVGLALAGPPVVRAPVVAAVAAGILFLAMRVWMRAVEPTLAKLLARRHRRIDRAIAALERRSLDARDTDAVEAQLKDALAEGFDAGLTALLTVDGTPRPLEAAFALVYQHGPVLRDLLDPEDPDEPMLRAALDATDADALVPLERRGDRVAVAAVAGQSLTRTDDALGAELKRLGDRAARGWVNARLYQEVERRGRGLEAQVRLRTSELENALEELKAAQAKLVEAERSSSLGLLVAGISHEINNALNFISANLPTLQRYAAAWESVVKEAPPSGDAALTEARRALPAAISAVAEATRRTGAIVGDLRRFARPDTERRLFRLEEGLDAALNLLRRRTDGRLDVARVYMGSPSVEGYPGPLNQCFFNLLLNAVEAARSEVWILLRDRGARGGVELTIRDDGDGIDPEHIDQIFRPFFTTKGRAGLGLTVAKGVVERHGGTLAVSSEPGEGATVRVRLPDRAPDPALARMLAEP